MADSGCQRLQRDAAKAHHCALPVAVQMLCGITAAYGTKLLGDKQASEASMAIRDCLCAAAAAHSFRRPQVRWSPPSWAAVSDDQVKQADWCTEGPQLE
jgi:hypothetical protein